MTASIADIEKRISNPGVGAAVVAAGAVVVAMGVTPPKTSLLAPLS